MVGLGNVDNTSDWNKPISTATQSAIDLKAPLASPTFTGNVSGITTAMVGLGNSDNTADINKPISTATQTALNNKQDKFLTYTGPVSYNTASQILTIDSYSKTETYTKISNLINSAPATLDTLKEIATAINNDPAVYNTLNSAIGHKQDKY